MERLITSPGELVALANHYAAPSKLMQRLMETTYACEQVYEGELSLPGHSLTKHIPAGLKRDFNTSSRKPILTLLSQEQLRTLLILDLKLRAFFLNPPIATLNHMVDGHVAGLKHGIKVEGRGAGGMHCAGDPEGLPAAVTCRLNL
jgi:hypothetical protein